jgi:hypothetical protein
MPQVTFAGLMFTMQKNGIPSEVIAMTCWGDQVACPVNAIVRQVQHLCNHGATATTKLYWYYDETHVACQTADQHVTTFLRLAATLLGHEVQTTAGALCCSSATALLEGQVPIHLIKLNGRWRSDKLFCDPIANTMLGSHSFSFPIATHPLGMHHGLI